MNLTKLFFLTCTVFSLQAMQVNQKDIKTFFKDGLTNRENTPPTIAKVTLEVKAQQFVQNSLCSIIYEEFKEKADHLHKTYPFLANYFTLCTLNNAKSDQVPENITVPEDTYHLIKTMAQNAGHNFGNILLNSEKVELLEADKIALERKKNAHQLEVITSKNSFERRKNKFTKLILSSSFFVGVFGASCVFIIKRLLS